MYDLSCPSLGNSTISCDDQASLPNGELSLKMGVPFQQSFSFKQRGARFPDQESSSTQSTGQSYPELPTIGSNIQPPQKDGKINDGKVVDGQVESSVSVISQDSIFTPSQMDYKQSLSCVSLPNAEPYLGGFMATYCPHTMMMGLATSRVPLPFDPFRDEPVYVNPKQYHGILRRRQQRAKLEALNKLTKDRKPYLHESRHLHAVRRARGSGGRFVSAKKLHESKPGSAINGISRSEAHNSGKYRDGSCTTSSSDVTTASNGEIMFPNPNFRFSNYSPYVGGKHKWSLQ